MSLRDARNRFNPEQVKDTSPQDREVAEQARAFLELWGPIKANLRDIYVEGLKSC